MLWECKGLSWVEQQEKPCWRNIPGAAQDDSAPNMFPLQGRLVLAPRPPWINPFSKEHLLCVRSYAVGSGAIGLGKSQYLSSNQSSVDSWELQETIRTPQHGHLSPVSPSRPLLGPSPPLWPRLLLPHWTASPPRQLNTLALSHMRAHMHSMYTHMIQNQNVSKSKKSFAC